MHPKKPFSRSNTTDTAAIFIGALGKTRPTHYNKVDGELDRVYQKIISRLSKTRRTKLREAQRVWILFRDKSAAFEASEGEGGTMYPLVYQSALASMTEKRIDELKDILQRMDSQ